MNGIKGKTKWECGYTQHMKGKRQSKGEKGTKSAKSRQAREGVEGEVR